MPPTRPNYALSRSSRAGSFNSPYLTRPKAQSVLSSVTSEDTDYPGPQDNVELGQLSQGQPRPRRSGKLTRSITRASTPTLVDSDLELEETDDAITLRSVNINGIELRPTIAFDTFWTYAAERKAIDDRRRAGESAPWTDDPILRDYFFCNTYRVLDRVTQYIIKEVIEKGPQDPVEVVFRVVLFNTFTKIETWERLQRKLGPLTWASYDREKYERVLSAASNQGRSLYTGAFIKPAPHFESSANHVNHLYLLEVFMENEMPSKLLGAPSLANVFEYLVSFPGMGDFTTYQLMLNLSYTNVLNFHRNDFVIPGPGALSGIGKIFDFSAKGAPRNTKDLAVTIIRWLTDTQDQHFKRLGLNFSGLGPKKLPMDVADIEHTLCEVDKYCRLAHPGLIGKRTEMRRAFTPASRPYPAKPVLPKAWSNPARHTPRIRPGPLCIEKRYTIRRIGAHRNSEKGREFLVYWQGYSDKEATWEYESSLLQDAPVIVQEYLANLKSDVHRTNLPYIYTP